ncbi:LysR family transcriptional regulator [Rhizobium leguminosarum]|uniref:LysR substrate-binding domain-containing protein n=1 Tax=Rhizobium TaxID=379 RepID=UPI001C901131|nr:MULTISPECIES: LysR substrate-binding domain-containing protein [Rhizobium]MBY3040413.1 LysR family transcriptional regulator [Rhizobium laguerreae]MBY3189183.1 LysR family transcriptional regulator [Rhizobium laguerreae]MBY5635505.1 LysR family transcriptional regulator [Rhizobium leguminosarum]MBY5691854.1 LysR family transcriptional regulator [Rhizobium leguminosarum]
MDTAWLLDLRALAETLNFSRAAEMRNITQPAFGRRIKAFEEWSGSVLVDRSTHRIIITPPGEIMLDAANDILQRIERATHDLSQERSATATLTFAATHALSFTFFPGWVQSLGSSVATVPIRLLSDNMNECEKMMAEGRAQFLLCHFHPNSEIRLHEADFKHVELASDILLPVAQRGKEGAPIHKLPGTPEIPVPHISFDEKSGMGRILAANLSPVESELHLVRVFTSHLAMVLKALALEGKGVAWIPRSLASSELEPEGKLAVAGDERWMVPVKIVLIRSRTRMTELAEKFWMTVESASKRTPV